MINYLIINSRPLVSISAWKGLKEIREPANSVFDIVEILISTVHDGLMSRKGLYDFQLYMEGKDKYDCFIFGQLCILNGFFFIENKKNEENIVEKFHINKDEEKRESLVNTHYPVLSKTKPIRLFVHNHALFD